jgi:hypothetical protein
MFALFSRRVVPSRVPPLVIGQARYGQLKIPRPVVLEIRHGTIPAPRLGDPLAGHGQAIRGVLVGGVAPRAFGRTSGRHVNGIAVNLTVSQPVAGEKVTRWRFRPVLHEALDTQVKTVRVDIVGPNPWLAIRAVGAVKGPPGRKGGVNAAVVAVVAYLIRERERCGLNEREG